MSKPTEIAFYDKYHDGLTEEARDYKVRTLPEFYDKAVVTIAYLNADLQVQRKINRALKAEIKRLKTLIP